MFSIATRRCEAGTAISKMLKNWFQWELYVLKERVLIPADFHLHSLENDNK